MITNENDNLKVACSTSVKLIKKIYEMDSLICPHCDGQLRLVRIY
jgi:hypothetical protein